MQSFITMLGIDDSVNVLIYLAIFILFVFGFFKCIVPVIRTRTLLAKATRNIKRGDKKRSWQ
ncbi:MAG: hypothetical protein ACOYI5_11395, partial [Christensenellales bacterium]